MKYTWKGHSLGFWGTILIILGVITIVAAILITAVLIGGGGIVRQVGVKVYSDAGLTQLVTYQDWGYIDPGEQKVVTWWIVNTGNAPGNLSMWTDNWVPAEAELYFTVSWNYTGVTIDPAQYVVVEYRIYCDPNVTGITNFNYDTTIQIEG